VSEEENVQFNCDVMDPQVLYKFCTGHTQLKNIMIINDDWGKMCTKLLRLI